MSKIPFKAMLYPKSPNPVITPLQAGAISELPPRAAGFDICTSIVGNETCVIAAARAGCPEE